MDAFDLFGVRAARSRGAIIGLCALLETLLDDLLSKYFGKDEPHQKELVELIFAADAMNLRSKYHLLIKITKRKCAEGEYDKKFKGLQKRFDEFTAIRNKFAHEPIIGNTLKDEFYNKYEICLMDIAGKDFYKCYTADDIFNIMLQIDELKEEILGSISNKILANG